ncbi:hypothetical protein COCSUDRAFT_53436 [Coccomyxa subellipsoidea C-169]|uniref:peptidylprolyl isomerase n=1 Tax=Coccomyxa subellipsoidea (strain C-169) TaxID=574566 RepID=I0YZ90_COCSC|nr:hypothetical protein COCSUDRAFT_53436 [Coccomyxa subellipsoidea C-169]EIE23709.1 hypothetical protein COCSUDRAFT_53436 [Coccomyxa subellipsoidea C-169]|eukprot:XP_005648253.1 hypothetical protein COCSUDRAFT_53436 [Coccomyxa subellipsoidea C-169]
MGVVGMSSVLLQAPGMETLRCTRPFKSAGSSHIRAPSVVRPCCRAQAQDGPTPQRRDFLAFAASAGILAAIARPENAAAVSVPQCEELTSAPNGIQYCEVREGTGNTPAKGSLIRCHYRGRLASNNAVFDSSYERGRPLTFKVGVREVIAGWDVGILGDAEQGIPPMKEGGKRVLVIPPELAYGDRGAGRGVIPPKATLIFDVELLGKR